MVFAIDELNCFGRNKMISVYRTCGSNSMENKVIYLIKETFNSRVFQERGILNGNGHLDHLIWQRWTIIYGISRNVGFIDLCILKDLLFRLLLFHLSLSITDNFVGSVFNFNDRYLALQIRITLNNYVSSEPIETEVIRLLSKSFGS